MHWIVVQVKPQQEEVAVKNLAESGFTCYCPQLTLRKGLKVVKQPMFTGYIFARIELEEMPVWRTINSHRGVLRMLMTSSGKPGLLPEGWVEELQTHEGEIKDFEQVVQLTRGQKIRFTAGPLNGIEGKVQWTNRERVGLLIDLLGRDTLVQSTINLVSPV